MKFMVANQVFTEENGPMILHLTEQDKKNIAAMVPGATFYMIFDEEQMSKEEAREYINKASKQMND